MHRLSSLDPSPAYEHRSRANSAPSTMPPSPVYGRRCPLADTSEHDSLSVRPSVSGQHRSPRGPPYGCDAGVHMRQRSIGSSCASNECRSTPAAAIFKLGRPATYRRLMRSMREWPWWLPRLCRAVRCRCGCSARVADNPANIEANTTKATTLRYSDSKRGIDVV